MAKLRIYGTVVAVVVGVLVLIVVFGFAFSRTYDGRTLLEAAGGGISFNGAVTRIILEHRMARFGVPEAERRRLDETLTGVPGALEGTAESDRRELARLIIDSGADGEITEKELTDISVYIEEITK